jgi:hypothetical protein
MFDKRWQLACPMFRVLVLVLMQIQHGLIQVELNRCRVIGDRICGKLAGRMGNGKA